VHFSELEGSWRVDAEYYQPAYFEMAAMLEAYPSTAPLEALSGGIVCGPFGSALSRAEYTHSGTPLVRVADLSSFVVTGDKELVFVGKETAKRLSRYLIEPGDIAVSQRGTIAMFALMSDDYPHWLISANLIGVRKSQQLNPFYLNVFLNSKYGTGQLQRLLSGQVQPKVTTDDVKAIVVPIPPIAFQEEIERLARESRRAIKLSWSLYRQAEQLLLEELGLSDRDLVDELYNEVKLSSVLEQARLDAEFFDPEYERLGQHIVATGQATTIDAIADWLHRGVQPIYVEDGDVHVIKSKNVGQQFIDLEDTERTSQHFRAVNERAQVRRYDVLINSTGRGTLGRTNCYLEMADAIADHHVTIIRPTADCDPVYLGLFLNSPVGRLQSESLCAGSSGQTELYPDAIARIHLFLPHSELQQELRDLVLRAYVTRRQSRTLLDLARSKVEATIEQSAVEEAS
jgi:type I restriction enzyme S subunit